MASRDRGRWGVPNLSHFRPGAGGWRGVAGALVLWVPLVTVFLDLCFDGTRDFGARFLITASIGDTVCLFCFGGVLILDRVWRLFKHPADNVRKAWLLGASALGMPLALPAGFWVGERVARLLGRHYHADLESYRIGIGFGAVTMSLFVLYIARRDARERVRDLENANLKAQLAALTAEMNPHMLFNALNTIASLAHDQPDRAEQTALELAEVYRGILRAAGNATQSLADELRLCEAYLRVEGARYGERLQVSFTVAEGLDPRGVHVPMLLLQPLVENAVRHGIAPRASRGTVSIRAALEGDRVMIFVDDDGVGLGNSGVKGNGRALANCKERLRLVYGEGAELAMMNREGGGTRARLSLPKTVNA